MRGFAVERPGRYVLLVRDIGPATAYDALIFTRPYAGTMILLILGIVLGGFCVIGGLVFTVLQLAGIGIAR